MNLCIINTFYYPDIIGGAEISVLKLAEGLSKKGINVVIICTSRKDKIEIINGVKIYRVKINNLYSPIDSKNAGLVKKVAYRILDLYNIFNYKELKDILMKENIDIVHTNNLYGISPVIWSICKKNNIKIIHTLRDYFLMCPKVSLLRNKKEICFNCSSVCKLYRKFNIKFSKKVDLVTAPSQFTLKLFSDAGYFNGNLKKAIYNSIDFDINEVKTIYNSKIKNKNKMINFIFMGAIDYHKGIQILLKAFNSIKNPNIKLHIAGRGKLEYLVKKYAVDDCRIIYHGFLNEKQKDKLLRDFDVMIVPSIWYEPFGRVVIDGYKYCMPVIGSDIGGISEIIKDKETGVLIKPNSVKELMNAVNYLSDRINVNRMLYSITKYIRKFDLNVQIDEFKSVYNKLIRQ
jgi:glycosyltransferase involved in cell wall biosynthesis